MPTNLTGRFFLIAAVLLACLYILFPDFLMPKPGESRFAANIRPGIDMVGGSSLLYEIKVPPGAVVRESLADDVIKALRERVDPEGVKNLVWRAQGNNQIEIQLPTSKEGEAARPTRQAFAKAEAALDALNVRRPLVEAALERPAAERAARLNELAARGGAAPTSQPGATSQPSSRLQTLFAQLIDARAKLDAAAGKDAAAESEAHVAIDTILNELPNVNVEVSAVESAVAIENAADRDAQLAKLKARDPSVFGPAIDTYVKAYDELQSVKNAVGDVNELKRLLRGSGVLSFHICAKVEDAGAQAIQTMIDRLHKDGPRPLPGDQLAWIAADKPGGFGRSTFTQQYNGKTYLLVWMTPNKSLRNTDNTPKWALQDAHSMQNPDGEQVVAFSFDPVGANLFATLTGNHTPESPGGPFDLAAVLDNRVISNASINSQIGAHGTISGGRGGFKPDELAYLERTLRAGSLPAQLGEEPLVERTVGPQLGADNLAAGRNACLFGVVVVAIFLIGYYYLAGVVAMIAVLVNIVLIFAGMSALQATFTLPGVAGIVLTIGMAVDSNVLIFERLREEQQRGLSLRVALRNAYDRAFTAILDSNVTAAITGVILWAIGTEDVKGFGLTLLLGIVASLFTSLFVTKTIFALLIDRMGVEKLGSIPLSFPGWDNALKPNVDWMRKRWLFLGSSLAFIVAGLVLFAVQFQKGRVLDIEFAGGTIVQFNLKEPMPQEAVRDLIDAEAEREPTKLAAPNVQSVGDSVRDAQGRVAYKTYEVVTVTADANAVRAALSESLQGKLDIAQAANFDGAGKSFADVRNTPTIVPIEAAGAPPTIPGLDVASSRLGDHPGGVAIVIRDLSPMLAPADIRARLDQQRSSATAGGGGSSFKKYDVQALADGKSIVVLASDPTNLYSSEKPGSEEAWAAYVAQPTWDAINDAITKPAEFSRVSTINQTIASGTSANAVIALITSVVLIVIYVWIRFGDLKYGSATVVALVHDVLITLAALGFAHVLASTVIGDWLLLEPFRLNLTMVSAILTIIGFSMSDTVVVFDRIRENRDKIGHVDRQVINDSINQTLSRTLLTGGTTLVTLLAMYITGGPAIHGFTFALFVGLLTGTYSSIAIASPILLLGGRELAPKPTHGGTLPTARPAVLE